MKVVNSLVFCLSLVLGLGAQSSKGTIAWEEALKQEADWYASAEAIRIANNLLVYQHPSGGWPKNMDMAQILSKTEVEGIRFKKQQPRADLNRATIDNWATSSQMRFLAKVFERTKIEKFRVSFLQGVHYLLDAQYENGGWPQFYPIRKGYFEHITFNDDAMVNTLSILDDVYTKEGPFKALRLNEELRAKAREAFNKGIQCILNTQIRVNGKRAVWCAQHDKNTLAPAKARSYELESFSGAESVRITQLLMELEAPSDTIIEAINGAITWFENHKIEGIRVVQTMDNEGKQDLVVRMDSTAGPLWARFYDLETGMPFFCSRDGIKKSTLSEISYERRNGYRWYTDAPNRLFDEYREWKKKLGLTTEGKPRVIVSTDIGGTDPDDFQSMIHYLMYADRFDTEGLIASPYGEGRKADILEMIALYEQDFLSLKKYADYPEPDSLRSITKQGAKSFAPPQGWREQPTEGSQWIIQKANAESDRPLWILVWGGLEDLAQALHDAPEIASKINVYWIGGPNKKWSVHAYLYIVLNFPNLWFIEANSTYRGWFLDTGTEENFSNRGFYEHAIQGKGAMGSAFGQYYGGELKMGDTPSVVYLLSGNATDPQGESWGGSFVPLPYSAFRSFERHTNIRDKVPAYSVLEWSFNTLESNIATKEPTLWMEIDGQRIDGFYEGNGSFKVRFVPKRADTWTYTIYCDVAELDAQKGVFVSTNPWPGQAHPANISLHQWWTDRKEKANYLGIYQGAKTVSKWRTTFLEDWAVRLSWLEGK